MEQDQNGNFTAPKTLFALNRHQSRVNAIKWLSESMLVSIGGDEKSIVVWALKNKEVTAKDPQNWFMA